MMLFRQLPLLALTLTLTLTETLAIPVWALPLPPDRGAPGGRGEGAARFSPPPPPDRGAPGDRGEGASRGPEAPTTPLALVPMYQSLRQEREEVTIVTQVWGLTTSERSPLWFSIPYGRSSRVSLDFTLKDAAGKTLYQTKLPLPEKPGIVSVRLPATVPPLAVGQMHHWILTSRPLSSLREPIEVTTLEGWIQRRQPDSQLIRELAKATPQQRAALYAQKGIWYDALTTLAELRQSRPADRSIQTDWATLLRSIDLEKVAEQPIVACCKP